MIALYIRVSTDEQAKKGYSVRNQIEECQKKANGDTLEYIDKGFSGEFLERPALTRLRRDVKEGIIKKVVCYDPDRLSRKLMNALIIDEEFRRKGVEMIYINGEYANSPEGQLFYALRGAVSEFEKAKINERMTSGRRKKAKEGKVVKDSKLYGYYFKDGAYHIKEEEARIVRYIFDQFTNENVGMNSIAFQLTKDEIPTKRRKGGWHRQVVRQILMNESYTGKYYQNKWKTEGMLVNKYTNDPEKKVPIQYKDKSEWIETSIPQIIGVEQFEHAQELLKESRRRFAKESQHKYLLSGLVRCGNCQNTMVGHKATWWGKEVFLYSDVKNYAGAKNKGCGMKMHTKDLEEPVWNLVQEILDNPEKIAEYNQNKDVSREKNEVEIIRKEIGQAKKGRERLYKLVAISDDINIEEIKKEIASLSQKEESLTTQLKELNHTIEGIESSQTDVEYLKEQVKKFLKRDLSFEDKQTLVRILIKQIIVHDRENIEIITF